MKEKAAGAVLLGLLGIFAVLQISRGIGERSGDTSSQESAEAHRPVFTEERLAGIRATVSEAVEQQAFPGATLALGTRDREIHLAGFGAVGWTRNAAGADPRTTIYDLASVTKAVATASAVMLLVEQGRMRLDDPLSIYLPAFEEGPKALVTIRHLLTHTSGLPAGAVLQGDSRAARLARAASFPIYPPSGARAEYSDIGYILLWEAAEKAAGEPLPGYLDRNLYRPLGMTSTGFSPGLDCERCAPTGRLRDQSLYRGKPFDPLAQRLDGVTGNAGLFSTAHDLGRFAAMLTNDGELDGVRVFQPETVREFLGPQPVGSRYRLAWEVFCEAPAEETSPACATPFAIGHSGWTGTAMYIEPQSGVWVVLLTNRTYEPRGPNLIRDVRRGVLTQAIGHQPLLASGGPEQESR